MRFLPWYYDLALELVILWAIVIEDAWLFWFGLGLAVWRLVLGRLWRRSLRRRPWR